jgi:hypothetical protein
VIEGDENEEELGGMKSPVESKFEVFYVGEETFKRVYRIW